MLGVESVSNKQLFFEGVILFIFLFFALFPASSSSSSSSSSFSSSSVSPSAFLVGSLSLRGGRAPASSALPQTVKYGLMRLIRAV